MKSSNPAYTEFKLVVDRFRRKERERRPKRSTPARDLWAVYVQDGPGRLHAAANEPPDSIA